MHLGVDPARVAIEDLYPLGTGKEGADDRGTLHRVRAQNRKRIAMAAIDQRIQRVSVDAGGQFGAFDVHAVFSVSRSTMAAKPPSGMGSHFGRFLAS